MKTRYIFPTFFTLVFFDQLTSWLGRWMEGDCSSYKYLHLVNLTLLYIWSSYQAADQNRSTCAAQTMVRGQRRQMVSKKPIG